MGRTCFSCFQCHGIRGEGGAAAALPRLSGQDQRYLTRSLEDFASGARESATMRDVAQALTPQQRQDVALYYSVVAAPPALLASTSEADAGAQAGSEIEQQGLPDKGVPACATCHSVELGTQGPPYPYLSGQFADYLEQQLEQFRAGTRRGPDAQVMQVIAKNLTTEQARLLSEHFASQAPPRSLSQQAQR
ncbi:c-type cytochrome [Steroidobacter cummioxidans]|uniref:c-type cytochrome n=1 Tax=Steroidobacter cummioxidans TaxID=1803913 RepID=UPI0023AF5578|nr:c-type cytochrome [Steroidobacter cummioxidans]